MRSFAGAIVAAVVTATVPCAADPAYRAGEDMFRPPIEWSTWLRIGAGVTSGPDAIAPRTSAPIVAEPQPHRAAALDGAIGADASLPLSIGGNVRLGAWAEQRGLAEHDAFGGGELVWTAAPRHMEMFAYDGSGILALRAGRSATAETAAVSYGYLAPWKLEGPCAQRFYGIFTGVCEPRPNRTTRYMAGVRVVGTVTRELADPRVWSATIGVEFEPLGALRMFLVRRDWY